MNKIEKPFTDCTIVFLEKTFGLRQVPELDDMKAWIEASKSMEINSIESSVIPIFQKLLITNAVSWHEQDLSLHFNGPIFSLVGFTEPYRYNLFAERRISASLTSVKGEEIYLFGRPDEMIASGFREPESPFFCFQEFKRETDPNGDPVAQNLAAMLVAQAINENTQPIYGCYILGRDWYFMVLVGQRYCISRGYDASTEHVFDLFRLLKTLKLFVDKLTQ